MVTIYDIGDTVHLEATVKSINIDKNGTIYQINFINHYGVTLEAWVDSKILINASPISKKEDMLNAEAET